MNSVNGTNFILCQEKGKSFQDCEEFGLRWFTPTNEVPLCGHATLAAATVLFRVSDVWRLVV